MYYTCNARSAQKAIVHPELTPGTIMASDINTGYGLDHSFYVVERRTPTMVVLRELERGWVDRNPWGSDYSEFPTDTVCGDEFRCKIQDYHGKPFCNIGRYETAWVWDGNPMNGYNYS